MTREHERPLRVLHIVDTMGVGGAETWLVQLLQHWASTKTVSADILLTSGNGGALDKDAEALGSKLFYCRYGRTNLPAFLRSYRHILRTGRYDAIHDHQDYTSGWRWLFSLGRWTSVRVSHVHNPWMHYEANYSLSLARKLTAATGKRLVELFATHVCGTSGQILREYGFEPGATRPAVSVVHCGFDVARFNADREPDRSSLREEFGWGDEARVVLFAGRLDRAMAFDHPQNHKNSWFALHIARAAALRDERVRLVMAGAGDDMRDRLEATVAEWGLSDRLRLVGVRHDMPRLMRGSDLLLFPSRQEGLGMVAVEAQAAGLPVLASTAVPRECVVLPDLCDFLPLSEDVETWADRLLAILDRGKPELDACREALCNSPFSIENSAANLERIYRGEA